MRGLVFMAATTAAFAFFCFASGSLAAIMAPLPSFLVAVTATTISVSFGAMTASMFDP